MQGFLLRGKDQGQEPGGRVWLAGLGGEGLGGIGGVYPLIEAFAAAGAAGAGQDEGGHALRDFLGERVVIFGIGLGHNDAPFAGADIPVAQVTNELAVAENIAIAGMVLAVVRYPEDPHVARHGITTPARVDEQRGNARPTPVPWSNALPCHQQIVLAER